VTSNRDRQQRAAARARLEQNMTLRAQVAERRRRIKVSIAGAAAFVVVIGTVVLIAVVATGGDDKKAAAKPTCGFYRRSTRAPPAPQPLPSIQKVACRPRAPSLGPACS
jgi:hypothetical protein